MGALTGSRASHEADKSSSPKASIPSAEEVNLELRAIEAAYMALNSLDTEGRARAMLYLRERLLGDNKLRDIIRPLTPERQIELLDHLQQVLGELAYDVSRAR